MSIRETSIICCCFVSEIGADGIREGVYGKQMGPYLVSVLVLPCVYTRREDLRRCALTSGLSVVTGSYKQTDGLTNYLTN
jgi:hypothetical protein